MTDVVCLSLDYLLHLVYSCGYRWSVVVGTYSDFSEKFICSTAFFAFPVCATIMTSYNSLKESLLSLQIPYVMVRTHSDFLQKPIVQTGEGMWETSPDALPQNFEDGYPYAIATGSTAVLNTLERRCHATNGVDHAMCQYRLANIFSD